jgi:hypothetical protein
MYAAIVIIVVLVVLIVGVLIYAVTRPGDFRIERSASMAAPPDKIFQLINDFHHWTEWSPWDKIDPALKRTYSGANEGRGAMYEWEGNKQVGKGRMEITDSSAPSKIVIKLDFLQPFEAHNTAEFTLNGAGGSTTVNWAMIGKHAAIMKVLCLFMNMDKMVGGDFEKGLASIKAIVEK